MIEVLLAVWSSDSFKENIKDRVVVLVCEGEACKISFEEEQTTCGKIASLKSTQEETDTRLLLYCKYGREKGFKYARVQSPDSDIFFILLYYARYLQGINILFETGKGNNKRIINVRKIAENHSQVNCAALLGLHAITGCDSTSAFKGKWKSEGNQTALEKRELPNGLHKIG